MATKARALLRSFSDQVKVTTISNGAAALAFFFILAIFPAAIFFLTLLPYLPIPNLYGSIMRLLDELLPGQTAALFSETVREILRGRSSGLLSFGFLFTLWSASSGMVALMEQLNVANGVNETRPYWKTRGIAILLLFAFAVLVMGAFALMVFGGLIHQLAAKVFGHSATLLFAFRCVRWLIIAFALTLGFSLIYRFGPNVRKKFTCVSVGSVAAMLGFIGASLGFRAYVNQFQSYNKTYGSLGAAIALMFWLYITGLAILLGSEINVWRECSRQAREQSPTKKAA